MSGNSEDPIGRADRVYQMLEDLIVNGELAPGDRLDERALAERFNVSRTPVREALKRLSSSGLVVSQGRQSTYVAGISVAELFETFEVLAELEGLCAMFSAQRMTDSELNELRGVVDRFASMEVVPDIPTYIVMNETYHGLIYNGAHNNVLVDCVVKVNKKLSRYRRFTLRSSGRVRESIREHIATAEAILRGDAAEAQKLMRHHVDIRRIDHAQFVSLLSNLEARPGGIG